jgi:hypothetical protein
MDDEKEVRIVCRIDFDPFLSLEVRDERNMDRPDDVRRIVTVYSGETPVLDLFEEEVLLLALALIRAMEIK